MPHSSERSAIVLAGGESSRFGPNKALELLSGKPLICHVANRLIDVVDEILVIIAHGESRAKYEEVLPSPVKVVNDVQEGKNPLLGIVTGLQAARSDYTLISACDTPFVNEEVIKLLFQRASGADAAIPRWNKGNIEPLEAVYRTVSTLHAARETLTLSNLPLREMIGRLGRVVYVSVENEISKIDHDLITFFNVNTREDMGMAEKMLRSGYLIKRSKLKQTGEG